MGSKTEEAKSDGQSPELGSVLSFCWFLQLFYVWGCFVYTYVCATSMCLVPMEARRESGPLELELQTIVSLHVGVGNWTWDPQRGRECS